MVFGGSVRRDDAENTGESLVSALRNEIEADGVAIDAAEEVDAQSMAAVFDALTTNRSVTELVVCVSKLHRDAGDLVASASGLTANMRS